MANFNFNKVILGGRLTADPELKSTPSGIPVCSITVAVNRRPTGDREPAVDFFTVTAWRQTAEFITRYFRKASSICVVGKLQSRTWTDKQTGQQRYTVEVTATEVYFVDAMRESPFARDAAQAEVDPSSPAMAGAGTTGEKMPEQVYATSDARAGIESGMSEGDEPLPF